MPRWTCALALGAVSCVEELPDWSDVIPTHRPGGPPDQYCSGSATLEGDAVGLGSVFLCVEVTGNLMISGMEHTPLDLPVLKHVGMDLGIEYNPGIEDVAMPSLVEVEGALSIWNNDRLTDLDGLDALTRVGKAMYVLRNPALRTISGFGALEHANNVYIGDNEALESLDGMGALVEVGELRISENPALTSLAGLASLERAGSVRIADNPMLCQGEVDALLARLEVRGPVAVGRNNGDCP